VFYNNVLLINFVAAYQLNSLFTTITIAPFPIAGQL